MTKHYLLILLFFWAFKSNAQNLNKIEYFIDADPGYGAGVDIPFTASTILDVNFSVSLPDTISDGFHYLTIRVKNANNHLFPISTRDLNNILSNHFLL